MHFMPFIPNLVLHHIINPLDISRVTFLHKVTHNLDDNTKQIVINETEQFCNIYLKDHTYIMDSPHNDVLIIYNIHVIQNKLL